MSRWTVLSIYCVLCATSGTLADIHVWEGDPSDCTISDTFNTIQIDAAGTYGFRAWDGIGTLEAIQWIRVQSGVTGTVTVKVAYSATGGNGATNVWEIDLSNAGIGNIAELRISGDLGDVDDIVADNITGTFNVTGDVLHMIDIGNDITGAITIGGDLEAAIDVEGDIEAALTITGYLLADISADSASDITINGSSGTHTGDITINGPYADTLLLNDSLSGQITIGRSQ
ncbi:MAG: hypothetical protein KKB50_21560 [Planctomycetes bacterium]|nr:hypothetical protein [Planctomycetota bacterium]